MTPISAATAFALPNWRISKLIRAFSVLGRS
ncbi:hypothetical protein QF030_000222 [Streptomyces rishiriensis]|uniref:Uncharacterized protein n=1 Tax=Streptomyces rishiriensis TaxID=68264 RepID=A0ABU0NG26_STRRH|nr:hypothetical protein [Streptomyces rishiriensis]